MNETSLGTVAFWLALVLVSAWFLYYAMSESIRAGDDGGSVRAPAQTTQKTQPSLFHPSKAANPQKTTAP